MTWTCAEEWIYQTKDVELGAPRPVADVTKEDAKADLQTWTWWHAVGLHVKKFLSKVQAFQVHSDLQLDGSFPLQPRGWHICDFQKKAQIIQTAAQFLHPFSPSKISMGSKKAAVFMDVVHKCFLFLVSQTFGSVEAVMSVVDTLPPERQGQAFGLIRCIQRFLWIL